ncbi:MAG: hypothetical protein WBC91_01215 [Phototrophicaceae bacterium]
MMENPAEQLKKVPLTLLVPDLLKQFNKPSLLAQRGVILSKVEIDDIGEAVNQQQPLPDNTRAICEALADIVRESLVVLDDEFSLSFERALQTLDISDVAAWETTADFLEIANIKSNAELRISAGCSLMVFLGDASLAKHLLTLIKVDAGTNDVDAMIAKRALSTYAKVDIDADDWLMQITETLAK